jgi:hypothetical protein
MNEIYITKQELDFIVNVVRENEVDGVIKLIYDNESDIGSTLSMEFDFVLNSTPVTVRVNVTHSDSW